MYGLDYEQKWDLGYLCEISQMLTNYTKILNRGQYWVHTRYSL